MKWMQRSWHLPMKSLITKETRWQKLPSQSIVIFHLLVVFTSYLHSCGGLQVLAPQPQSSQDAHICVSSPLYMTLLQAMTTTVFTFAFTLLTEQRLFLLIHKFNLSSLWNLWSELLPSIKWLTTFKISEGKVVAFPDTGSSSLTLPFSTYWLDLHYICIDWKQMGPQHPERHYMYKTYSDEHGFSIWNKKLCQSRGAFRDDNRLSQTSFNQTDWTQGDTIKQSGTYLSALSLTTRAKLTDVKGDPVDMTPRGTSVFWRWRAALDIKGRER